MWGIIVAILVLSLVIIIHELGHFLAARRAGILCHEFSLGMGPILWSKKIGETLYCVRAIPLGGYVAMAGEEVESELIKTDQQVRIITEGNVIVKIILDPADPQFEEYEQITVESFDLKGVDDARLHINNMEVKRDAFYVIKSREIQIAPADRNFNYKNKKQRFLAIFGGPFMNFVLAFFVFILFAFLQGFPTTDSSIIGEVTEGAPAYEVLLPGDRITEINGETVDYWLSDDSNKTVSDLLDKYMSDREVEITIVRNGVTITETVTPIIYFYSVGFHSQSKQMCTEEDIENAVLALDETVCVTDAVKIEATTDALIVGPITEGTQAYNAGMQQGDVIFSIDGTEVTTWEEVVDFIANHTDGSNFNMIVERDGTPTTLTIEEPWELNVVEKQGLPMVDSLVGISPEYAFSFGQSILYGFVGIKNSATMISDTLSLLFGSSQVGVGDLAGPVGIYQITNDALSRGFVSLLAWIGLLSVNLGVINLLPIPALDGGRLFFLGAEALGVKISTKIENRLHYMMYLLLLGLFVFITYNDIVRLIQRIF
jgi:regulator of sigma E protease